MVRSRLFLLVALVLVLGLFVTACQTTATAPAAAPGRGGRPGRGCGTGGGSGCGTVKVMTSWPLQGPMLPEGESIKRAVDLALKHYLEDHGGGPCWPHGAGGQPGRRFPHHRLMGCYD